MFFSDTRKEEVLYSVTSFCRACNIGLLLSKFCGDYFELVRRRPFYLVGLGMARFRISVMSRNPSVPFSFSSSFMYCAVALANFWISLASALSVLPSSIVAAILHDWSNVFAIAIMFVI